MSLKAMTAVWKSAPCDGSELLVLLALADWANDENKAWPKIAAIARKTRLRERQVYKCLCDLKKQLKDEDGAINRKALLKVEAGSGGNKPSTYTILVENFTDLHPDAPLIEERPALQCTPDLHCNAGGTCTAMQGDLH